MAGWKKTRLGELTVHQASTISWLPRVVQGFTTRGGGVSFDPFDSLNMSVNVGDDPASVAENRRRAVAALTDPSFRVATAQQVHGDVVAIADDTTIGNVPEADALITSVPGILLMMVFADCVPVYLVDPLRNVVGLAHSGWRGTQKNVIGKTVAAMHAGFGCEPWKLMAAIGPSISGAKYEVGKDVVDALWESIPMTATQGVTIKSDIAGTFNLNLRMIIFGQLQAAGLDPDHISVSDECTFSNRAEFFSHRRDGSPAHPVGRMAGLIGLRP